MDKDIVFNNPTKSIESELPIMDMMARDVDSICSNSSLRAAISIFNEKKLDTLPVVDEDGKVVGVLPRGDYSKLSWMDILWMTAVNPILLVNLASYLQPIIIVMKIL